MSASCRYCPSTSNLADGVCNRCRAEINAVGLVRFIAERSEAEQLADAIQSQDFDPHRGFASKTDYERRMDRERHAIGDAAGGAKR